MAEAADPAGSPGMTFFSRFSPALFGLPASRGEMGAGHRATFVCSLRRFYCMYCENISYTGTIQCVLAASQLFF